MAAKASPIRPCDAHQMTAGSAYASGDLAKLTDGRAAYVEGLGAVASGDRVSLRKRGVISVASASGTTFSKGDEVILDVSSGLAVPAGLTVDGSDDYRLGIADKAKTSGQLVVEVELNAQPITPAMPRPFVFEFDCEDGVDETSGTKNQHVLIPASANRSGLLILGIYGVVTEVFAGGTEDQGIVTVRDESNNTLATLTPTNAGADAVGDVIVGTNKLLGATTGDAIKTVAAGEYVDAQVTQKTSGSSVAGKMKVYVLAIPLA